MIGSGVIIKTGHVVRTRIKAVIHFIRRGFLRVKKEYPTMVGVKHHKMVEGFPLPCGLDIMAMNHKKGSLAALILHPGGCLLECSTSRELETKEFTIRL